MRSFYFSALDLTFNFSEQARDAQRKLIKDDSRSRRNRRKDQIVQDKT